MAFLQRLSDNFWSLVSPHKTQQHPLPTPETEARFKKPAHPTRRASIHQIVEGSRSMSPSERIGAWSVRSPSSDLDSSAAGTKRKAFFASSATSDAGRRYKIRRSAGGDVTQESSHADELDGNTLVEDEEQDVYDSAVDNTLVVDEAEWFRETPKKRVISLPEEHDMRHISTAELRAQGWDDDYITLIQKIAMRGFEPLLPAYWKFDFRFLPDELFESHDAAFISSVRDDHFRSGKALERLFELGGRVRDRVDVDGPVEPQDQVARHLKKYIKWANEDARLDVRSTIPILAIVLQPVDTPSATLRAIATRRCAALAARYREAWSVQRSVEISSPIPSPSTHASEQTLCAYPLPTFYAIVATYSLVAVMAYNPNDEDPEAKPMAFFDFRNPDYDVWNSLALAITVCHVRNVQMRIAEDTGLGLKQPQYNNLEDEDDNDDETEA